MFTFTLHQDEKPLRLQRTTEWMLLKPVLAICVALYVPVWLLLTNDMLYEWRLALLAWTVAVLLYGINRYVLWLLNALVITDRRIIKVNYRTIFQKTVSDIPLENISHLQYRTRGLLSSLLHYGCVDVYVRGVHQFISLEDVRNPEELNGFLQQLVGRHQIGETPESSSEQKPTTQTEVPRRHAPGGRLDAEKKQASPRDVHTLKKMADNLWPPEKQAGKFQQKRKIV